MFSSLIDQALHDGVAATRVAARSEFAPARHAPEPGNYDEQFVLADDSDRPLGNVRYRVVADTGQTFSGTTDSAGRTRRFDADTAAFLKIYTMET